MPAAEFVTAHLFSSALHKEQSGYPFTALLSNNYQSWNKRHWLHFAKGKLEKHSTQIPNVTPWKRLFAEWQCAQTHTDIPRHSSCERTKKRFTVDQRSAPLTPAAPQTAERAAGKKGSSKTVL